jgi:hypothetical protein
MGLDSSTIALRKNLDALEQSQKADTTVGRLRHTRRLNRASVDRLDHSLGRRETARAIEALAGRLTPEAVPDSGLRTEIDLILAAACLHLR